MPTPNFSLRLPPDLREALEQRAEYEHRSLGELIIAACRQHVLSEPDDCAERARTAEAERDRLRAELAAAGQARRGVLKSRLAVFAEALEAATPANPATAPRMAALTGFSVDWCRDLLRGAAATAYAVKLGDGKYAGMRGRDIRDGIGEVRALAQHGARKPAEGSGVTSPAHTRPIASAAATATREAKNAARENGGIAGVIERAADLGAPLFAAKDAPRPAVSAATAVFQEPGAGLVVTAPVPEPADHSGKRSRAKPKCSHYVPAGTKCKICE